MSGRTRVIPLRDFSPFHASVKVMDNGLIRVRVEREKLDRALVTMLVGFRGQKLNVAEITEAFNRRHKNRPVKESHVRHSLKRIIEDMRGVLRLDDDGKFYAAPAAIAALDRVTYKRINDK